MIPGLSKGIGCHVWLGSKLNAFEEAKLRETSANGWERRGTRQCHFFTTRIIGIACEVRLSLIFFSLEPVHVLFGIKHKQTYYFLYLQITKSDIRPQE